MKADIKVQLERLKRSFEECRQSFDEVSLLNLAHALRVIYESRTELEQTYSEESESLPNIIQTKKFKRFLGTKPFQMVPLPSMLYLDGKGVQSIFVLVGNSSDEELLKRNDFVTSPPIKKLNINAWFDTISYFARGVYGGNIVYISRKDMIKRLANQLGASHPVGNGNNPRFDVDLQIAKLMKSKILERPLPYYLIMSIAQEILKAYGFFTEGVKNVAA